MITAHIALVRGVQEIDRRTVTAATDVGIATKIKVAIVAFANQTPCFFNGDRLVVTIED